VRGGEEKGRDAAKIADNNSWQERQPIPNVLGFHLPSFYDTSVGIAYWNS
jgi:hypothetical protein